MHNMPISAGMFRVALVWPSKGCDGVDPPMQPHGAEEHYSPEGCVGWPLLWPKSQICLACLMQKLWPTEVCCRKLSKTDETIQFGLNSDWTSRNEVKPTRMRIWLFLEKKFPEILFLLFFFLLPGDRNLTHRLWKRHGWNWEERTKPNVKAVAEVYDVVVEGYGGAVVQACGSGVTRVIRTRNSNGTDTMTNNSTCRCRHKFNDANWKDNAKARMVYGTRWSKP
jgi:hypothetical protein